MLEVAILRVLFLQARAKGKKALVAVAVEVKSPPGFGRCRMRIIPDGSARTLHTFITDHVAPRSTVITDG